MKDNIFLNLDCMDKERGMPSYPDKHFDLAIVDPPYGIKESAHRNISRSKLAATKNYKKEFWDFGTPPKEYFNELFRVSKNQIIWGINYFVSEKSLDIGSGRIFWDKVNGDLIFSDGEIAYSSFHRSTRLFQFMWYGMLQGNMMNKEERIHPTQKPIALYKWLLSKYAKEGE